MVEGCPKMTANGLALGKKADFEALNCQPSTELKMKQNASFKH